MHRASPSPRSGGSLRRGNGTLQHRPLRSLRRLAEVVAVVGVGDREQEPQPAPATLFGEGADPRQAGTCDRHEVMRGVAVLRLMATPRQAGPVVPKAPGIDLAEYKASLVSLREPGAARHALLLRRRNASRPGTRSAAGRRRGPGRAVLRLPGATSLLGRMRPAGRILGDRPQAVGRRRRRADRRGGRCAGADAGHDRRHLDAGTAPNVFDDLRALVDPMGAPGST